MLCSIKGHTFGICTLKKKHATQSDIKKAGPKNSIAISIAADTHVWRFKYMHRRFQVENKVLYSLGFLDTPKV